MRKLVQEKIINLLEGQSFENMRFRTVPEIIERMINPSFVAGKDFNRNKKNYSVTIDKLNLLSDEKLLDVYQYVIYRFYIQM